MPANEQRLVELGLTSYEAKAYLALVRRDSSPPADVARLSRIPRQRIYDVLTTLVRRASPPTGRARRPSTRPSAPEFAIERLRRSHRREELDRLERSSRELIELLAPAFAEGQKERDPLDYIEVLRDRAAINERFGELQEGIQEEILVFTKPPYATPAQENLEGLEVSRQARGAERLRVLGARRSGLRRRRPSLHRGRRRGALRRAAAAEARDHRRDGRHVRDGRPGRRSSPS